MSRACASLVIVAAIAVHAPAASAEVAAATTVEATLDPGARTVRGSVELSLRNVSRAALDRVYLWLYPNRMSGPPDALDDVTYYWVYPRAENPGSMRLTSVSAGGHAIPEADWRGEPHATAGRGALWSVALPGRVPPGEDVVLRIEYRARIPERYGSFGCVDGMCTLMGGFYPMLAELDQAGWDLQAPPMQTRMRVTVDLTEPASAVLFGRWTEGAVSRVAGSATADYAGLVVAPRWHATSANVAGVELRYLSTEPPPPTDEAADQILPYTMEDHAGYAVRDASAMLQLIAGLDLSGPRRMTLVEVPLRFDIAEVHPRSVLVSDRYYRIWPADRFRKFHQRMLVRAVATGFLQEVLAGRGVPGAEAAVEADAAGSYLTDLFVLRQYDRQEFVDDILQPVSFIPAVDQLLYAPQTMFAGAYFGGVLDSEPLRDHPRRFTHRRPRGRLYYEKLRDLLEPEALQRAMRSMLVEGRRLRPAAEAAYGGSLDWFFRQWSRPYPRVDYRLADTSSRRLPGGGYEHAVTVERRTAPGDEPPVEPVRILVVDEDGERHQLIWDGREQRGVVRFRASARIDRVVVDPGGRLVEHKLPGDNDHPRFDNRDDHRTRFVYNSFGVLLDFSSLANQLLAADFSIGRVHDVENSTRLTLYRSAAVQAGLSARYRRAFGPTVHEDKLLGTASVRLSLQRLNSGFFARAGDVERAATELELGLGLGLDDTLFIFEPREADSVGVGGGLTLTRRDGVADRDPEYLVTGSLSVGASRVFTPWPSHTFVVDGGAAAVFGDVRVRSQLLGGGGPTRLRGYANGELFGRSRAIGHLEWRHNYVHDLDWNLGHYNFVRGIGGAAYLDAGVLSPCESYDLTDADSTYAAAGYGLRFFYDSFGTLPQMMRIDVAVRLVDRNRSCLDSAPGDFPPVMVYLGFLPPI